MKQFNRFTLIIVMALLAGLLAGCDEDKKPATPAPPTLDGKSGAIVNLPELPTATPAVVGGSQNIAARPNTNPTATQNSTATPVIATGTEAPINLPALPPPTPTPFPTPAEKIPVVGTNTPVDFSGKGKVLQLQFYSKIIRQNVPYIIYLPYGYDTSQKRYPVLYMLHGFSGDIKEWMDYGLLSRFDELISTGKVKPFIIVLPWGAQEYWMDHPNNGEQWGDYTAHEVVDHIDGNYRTIPLKESRALGGLSMGANGALQIAMNYPNIFGVIGAHSPTMRRYAEKLPWWGDQEWYDQHDPVTMVKTNQYISQVKLWVDIGTNDTAWRPRALELKQNLLDRKINFTWNDFDGGHDGSYWATHVPDYLSWYSSVLAFSLQ